MTRFSLQRLRTAMPTASLPVATLALVVATVGGVSAYAGTKIGTADIANNAVTTSKIKKANVKASDLDPRVKAKSWIWKPASVTTLTWQDASFVSLGTKTITTPAPGLLDVTAFGAPSGGGSIDFLLALVDYTGDLEAALDGSSPQAITALYDSLAAARSTSDGFLIELPKRVSAGSHTIKWYAVDRSAAPGDTADLALRQLTARFTPGITGSAPNWQLPELPPREAMRQILPH